jgi:nucleotidyltransferase substrate binding protein (TIGR01987 family)
MKYGIFTSKTRILNREERYQILLADYSASLRSFEQGLKENISLFTPTIQDLIRNGIVQKFEISSELAWKVTKLFIELQLGEIAASPKQVYRHLFTAKLIPADLLASLLSTIDDRNQLSHIYKEDSFEQISSNFENHLACLLELKKVIQ